MQFPEKLGIKQNRLYFLKACLILIIFSRCTQLQSAPPSTASTTIIINSLDRDCYKTATGSEYIDFDGTVTVYYMSRNGWEKLNEVSFTSPNSFNKFPVYINTQIPNNNSPYEIEINIIGKNCSRCASGYSLPTEPTGHCYENQVANGYQVAYPRWQFGKNPSTYYSQIIFNNGNSTSNVPNSCYTCTVPF